MLWSIITFIAGLIGADKVKGWAASHTGTAATVPDVPNTAPATHVPGSSLVYSNGDVQQALAQAAAPEHHYLRTAIGWILLALLLLFAIRAIFGADWWKVLPGVQARLNPAPITKGDEPATRAEVGALAAVVRRLTDQIAATDPGTPPAPYGTPTPPTNGAPRDVDALTPTR